MVGAVEDRDPAVPADRQPGLDLLQIGPAVLRMPPPRRRILLIRLRVRAIQRDRGQIPVQPRHIDAELGDRRRPGTAGDRVQLRGDRIQRPGDPVIVEQIRRDAIRLLHRHRRRPLVHPQHQRRRGQPAGHQRLDHLAVGDPRHRPDRAQLINDLRDPAGARTPRPPAAPPAAFPAPGQPRPPPAPARAPAQSSTSRSCQTSNRQPGTLFPTRHSKLQTTQQSAITQPPHASNLMCEDRV